MLALMLLLISGLGNSAAAHEGPKHPSKDKKAEKVGAYLNSIGINNPRITSFVSTVSERVEGKNLRVTEHHFENGRLVLHYQMRPKLSTRQLELKFQPANYPNTEFVASRRSIMLHHRWDF